MDDIKKEIIKGRLRFLIEVIIILIGLYFFLYIPNFILPSLVDQETITFSILYFILRATVIVLGIPLFLYLANIILESQKRELILEEDKNPSQEFISLYSIDKEDAGQQILYALLLLLVIVVPIDFLSFLLVPGMLEYNAMVLISNPLYEFLLIDLFILFLLICIIIVIAGAIAEEALYRGFYTIRGDKYMYKMSAVIIASLLFGIGHFLYILNPISGDYTVLPPLTWFLGSLVVGFVFSMYILKTKQIFPVIIAHVLVNIINFIAIWMFLNGYDFLIIISYLYIPLLISSAILIIWQRSLVSQGVSIMIAELRAYFKPDDNIKESNSDRTVRIIFDIVICLIIFILSFFLLW